MADAAQPETLDRAGFLALARARLWPVPPDPHNAGRAGETLTGQPVPREPLTEDRPAAVLVPVIARPREITVLLTQRAAHLRRHASQIAFPGGRVDAGDGSPLEAALREAEEEVGLARRYVAPLGYLDTLRTGTGFSIVPVVGWVEPGFTITPDPAEVADVFEVPFRFLMDVGNHQRQMRDGPGGPWEVYAMPYGDRHIWGATARIIRNLYEKLYGEA
jgi:8-oxo-dGTP pyrophosphatase MutT (NUDIX family)